VLRVLKSEPFEEKMPRLLAEMERQFLEAAEIGSGDSREHFGPVQDNATG
jgi:hypothetical protein